MKELITIQAELKAPKNQENKFGGYNYRSAEDILEAAKKVLPKYNCYLTLSDTIEIVGSRVYVVATVTITNAEGKQVTTKAYAREEEVKKGMDAAQITGSASSYARKYALNGLFCIDDTKEPDATNTHGKDAQSAVQPAKIDIKKAEAEITACKDGKTLSAVWGKYKDLPNNTEVEKIVKAQMEKLGITSNGNKVK